MKTIGYGKTFNMGNYESQRIDMTADLDEGEDERAVLFRLKALVLTCGGDVANAQIFRDAALAIEAERGLPV